MGIMTKLCFIDTETTGLDPDRHAIWEVALITPDGAEHVWQFPVDEMAADPFALNIGRYWERRWGTPKEVDVLDAIYHAHDARSRRKNFPGEGRAIRPSEEWAHRFRDLTAGCHLAGAVVSFDEERLRRLLHSLGVLHRWHYHLVDVEALAVGYLHGLHARGRGGVTDAIANGDVPSLPWKSDDLSAALGVTISDEDRHTALGDAKWARAIYDAVTGGRP
jgi:DNA polymerase III epsilon subunit-like protein